MRNKNSVIMEKMNIKYAKLGFYIKAETELILPQYKGSTLRGGFGQVLKDVVCAIKKDCSDCILKSRCVYSYVFETEPLGSAEILNMSKYERIPHPFILEPPEEERTVYPEGSNLSFNLILIGNAVQYFPYFVFAFLELGRRGIGRKKGKYSIFQIMDLKDSRVVFTDERQTLSEIEPSVIEIPDIPINDKEIRRVTLSLKTPLRLKFSRDLVVNLKFHMLLRNLLRRLTLIYYFHCERQKPKWDTKALIRKAENVVTITSDTSWFDWERYSSRQSLKLKMGGLIGNITFEGELNSFLPILKAGEILHAGKGTSFGLGRYEIVEIS
ncbi:MAG: CRISPR system precrRNA processing endoribonuclease RAMP protein Cas6 [Deltaproteobacteria bacterium]|nr:CRISPR system precrRNA processing endoribonuclease RAMP protein Cas6 [Deltaproteobacteria bacterium]